MKNKSDAKYYIWSVFITAALVLLVAALLFGILLHGRLSDMMLTQIKSNAQDIAGIAAELIDAEALARLKKGDEDSADYRTVLAQLEKLRDSSDVEYLYTIRYNDAGETVFVVDSDPEDPGLIDEPYTGSEAARTALAGNAAAEDAPYTDRWGTHISAYAPVFLNGEVVGAAVVDLRYGWVLQEIRRSSLLVVSLCVVFFLLSFFLLLYVARLMDRDTQQLLEAKERAEAGDRAKTAFFAQMSHEIRTPINAMCGMNEMILTASRTKQADQQTLKQIEEYAVQADDAGRALRAIMEDILDFAKLEGLSTDTEEAHDTDADAEEAGKQVAVQAFTAPDARILAVDDIEINLTVIEGLLAETEIVLDRAGGGEEALMRTKETGYDLILMDQRMPGMSGTETLHAIRAQEDGKNRETPVVCVTGDVLANALERYLEEGFTDYVPKPLTGDLLRALVGTYLPAEKMILSKAEDDAESAKKKKTADALPAEDADRTSLRARYGKNGLLDYDEACRVLGTDQLIEKTAVQFVNDAAGNADDIARMLAEEDYDNYTICVHALKGASRLIGATALSGKAAQLEAMGDEIRVHGITDAERKTLEAETETLLSAYRALVRELCEVFHVEADMDGEEDDADKPEMRADEVQELYEGILEFIENYDLDTIDLLIKQAKDYRMPENERGRFSQVARCVRNSDWDGLKKLLA